MKNQKSAFSQPWDDFRATISPDFPINSNVSKSDELHILCPPQESYFWALVTRVSLRSVGTVFWTLVLSLIHNFSSIKEMDKIQHFSCIAFHPVVKQLDRFFYLFSSTSS